MAALLAELYAQYAPATAGAVWDRTSSKLQHVPVKLISVLHMACHDTEWCRAIRAAIARCVGADLEADVRCDRLVEVVGEKRDDHNHEEQKDAKALKRWHSAVAATMEEKSRLKKMDERQTKSRFHLISRRDARDAVAQMQENLQRARASPLKSPPSLGALESVSEE